MHFGSEKVTSNAKRGGGAHGALMSLGILAGGGLGALVLERLLGCRQVLFVFTDESSQEVVRLARCRGVPLYVGNPRDGRAKAAMAEHIGLLRPDLLVSANYRFLIEPDLIAMPNVMSLNIHGSLLPKYRGRAPLIWAIINGEAVTGITVHRIDEGCDTGPILLQRSVEIPDNATGADMVALYGQIYPDLIVSAIETLETRRYALVPQDERLATWYGRRTPEDGRIDWSWESKRIQNWVRALAPPYPGAFCYCQGERLVVEKVSISDWGFPKGSPIGSLIGFEAGAPLVRVCNGVIRLDVIAPSGRLPCAVGDVFE
jgi:methionyl-tRNA formyltransferase